MNEAHIRELTTLKTIAETLNQSVHIQEMLDSVLEKLLDVTGLTFGWIFLIDQDQRHTLAADRNLPPGLLRDRKEPLQCGNCWCTDQFHDGRLRNAVNILNCRRLEEVRTTGKGETCGYTHHATVPLRIGERKFGLLNVGAAGKNRFSDEELALLQSVAYQIGIAVERIRLEQHRLELVRIEERNAIARDLHDSVSQLLFSIHMTSKGTEAMIRSGKAEAALDALADMRDMSKEALKEMRSLIMQLRPAGTSSGAAAAIAEYAKRLGLQLQLQWSRELKLPGPLEETLWRVGQEALNNVAKHAMTDSVAINLSVHADELIFVIRDNGRGIQPRAEAPQDASSQSFGMSIMRERVEAHRGRFRIDSGNGNGTLIEAVIPLPQTEHGKEDAT